MFKRLMIYLKEMFPATAFIGTIMLAFTVILIIGKMAGFTPHFHLNFLLAGISISTVTLLIRVMDEFKDYEDDLINFPTRPLPSGRVNPSDLKFLGWLCVILSIVLSAIINQGVLLIWSLLTVAYTYLMLKWFFIEDKMRKSLPLAFVTHHPILILNFVYLCLVAWLTFGKAVEAYLLLVFPLCLIFTNWEISRKIRAPEQETAYSTYSKIWGPRVATSLALFLQLGFGIGTVVILMIIMAPIWYLSLSIVVLLVLMMPYFSFLVNLKLTKPFKEVAELQVLSILVLLFVAAFL